MLELQYLGETESYYSCKLFDVCDNIRGIKIDECGFVSINCKMRLKTDEHFILVNHALYANDDVYKGWHVVLKSQSHSSYEMPSVDDPHGGSYKSESHEDSEQRSRKRRKGDI